MKRRLAFACARGVRQEALVNELLAYPVGFSLVPVGGNKYWSIGESAVSSSSYKNLHKRLVSVGFVLKRDNRTSMITMIFPEEGLK